MEYIVTAEEMKTADRNTTEIFGISPAVLMERAALCVAEEILALRDAGRAGEARADGEDVRGGHSSHSGREKGCPRVLIFAGGGGNGGDGIAVSRLLHQRGCETLLVAVGEVAKYSDIAREQLESAMKYGVPMLRLKEVQEAEAVRMVTERRFDVLVDALFGIGVSRPLAGVFSAAVALMNRLKEIEGERLTVLSIDMPSGIQTDTGEICGIAVRADVTVTMNHKKRGLVLWPGAACAGRIAVADAGITAESFAGQMPEVAALDEPARELLPKRDAAANKGGFGKLLIVAGNGRIGGAAILAAQGAFSAGVGMVRVFTEKRNRTALLQAVPEALIDGWEEGQPAESLRRALLDAAAWADAVLIGPGIGTGEPARTMLAAVLSDGCLPLVIDADGCNLIARDEALRAAVERYRREDAWPVLTPHMGEFARLAGVEIEAAKRAFFTAPKALADDLSCTVLCKDARSIAAQAGRREQIVNLAGNSGMASAGSGDVLAGIAGALAAQGLPPVDAAARASRLHALAGDAAAARCGEYAMTARDILSALREITR